MTQDPLNDMRYIDILTRLQSAYNNSEWELFRVDYLLYKSMFPEEAAKFCEHLQGEARNQCIDIIEGIEKSS